MKNKNLTLRPYSYDNEEDVYANKEKRESVIAPINEMPLTKKERKFFGLDEIDLKFLGGEELVKRMKIYAEKVGEGY